MKKRLLSLQVLFLLSLYSFSQGVGIGKTNPDASAVLDITATNKGLLIPRLSTSSINAIINPARGLLVYDSVANQLVVNIGTPGTPSWQPMVPGIPTSGWALNGNNGTNPASQFIGNADNQPLRFRVNNIQAGELSPTNGNVSWGLRAGQGSTTGFSNIAIGVDALKTNTTGANLVAIGDSAMFNSTGGQNLAIGSKSLFSNTSGIHNTAIGVFTLFANATGSRNTATGAFSLNANTTGAQNTAAGYESMLVNTTGQDNTAIGVEALFSNTTGIGNTAVGKFSLMGNATGGLNTAVGTNTLQGNTGFRNTAVGAFALGRNTGTENVGMGLFALEFNNTGSFNVAIGDQALESTTAGQFNVAVGHNAGLAFDNGFNNTIIGANSDFNQAGLSNSVALGEGVILTASNQARIGNAATSSIGGFANWTNFSDGRYKKNIQEGVKGIDFIMQLRPVTYQLDISGISEKLNEGWGKEMSEQSNKGIAAKEKTIFSGFVAQEVEKAAKKTGYDFSAVDKPKNENDFYGLRYAEFVVPLVKAVQEQQQMINELKKQNADLQKRVLDIEKK